MDISKIPVPEDVVDEAAFRKMKIYEQHPILRHPVYTASDGSQIDVSMMAHNLRKAIEHLSPKEQEYFTELKHKYSQINGKLQAYRLKAYDLYHKRKIEYKRLSAFEDDVIDLLGRMFTVAEVVRMMGEDRGITCTEDDVKKILRENVSDVERRREAFRNKITDVRLYNKRPRLEELAWMYTKMKARYVALHGIEAYNAMLRTLEQLRKEAEGDILTVNGAVDVNVEVRIQEHIQQEIFKTINVKEIILGRVAARMCIDATRLISSLRNSYYAKFTDISGMRVEGAEMSYPSNSAYDFSEIEKKAEKIEEAEAEEVRKEDTTVEQKTAAEDVREMLLRKIRQQRQEAVSRMTVMDTDAEKNREEVKEWDGGIDRSALGKGNRIGKGLKSNKTIEKERRADYFKKMNRRLVTLNKGDGD